MKIITTVAAIVALGALGACSDRDADDATTIEANTLVVDNLDTPDANMTMDMNTTDMNGMDMNTTMDTGMDNGMASNNMMTNSN